MINKLNPMFEAFHCQLAPPCPDNVIDHAFIHSLPEQQSRDFVPFSHMELSEALASCSTSSAPGPLHMLWALLKLFFADDAFKAQFLMLTNDIITEGVWPDVFKESTTIIIPKPQKEDYTKPKNFRPIALLECTGELISKLIAARSQSNAIQFNLLHPLQFGGLKF